MKELLNDEAKLIFQKAFETAELASLTEDQRRIYEENLIQYWGMKSAIETAVEEAVEEAVEKSKIEVAKMMLEDNESIEKIAKYTGLTVEQIQRLLQ